MKNKILVIGSIPHKGKGSTYGGVTVLNKRFVDFLKKKKVEFIFIPLNKFHFLFSNFFNSIYFFLVFIFKIKDVNYVLFNATYKGIYYISPLVYIFTKVLKKKFIIRMFAGNFDKSFTNANKLNRFIIRKTILNSDKIFMETKHLVKFLKLQGCNNVFWFPNVRAKYFIDKEQKNKYQSRFVFIGHVKDSKGIKEILEASKKITDDCQIDIYGPFTDGSCSSVDFVNSKVSYKGVLSPNDVITTLLNYDFLILPTYHEGEGYPGIIIEAFSVGVPVISTKWRAIPEILNNNNGVLIEPRNSDELAIAINSMNLELHNKLSLGAFNSFKDFEENSVYNRIINIIKN